MGDQEISATGLLKLFCSMVLNWIKRKPGRWYGYVSFFKINRCAKVFAQE